MGYLIPCFVFVFDFQFRLIFSEIKLWLLRPGSGSGCFGCIRILSSIFSFFQYATTFIRIFFFISNLDLYPGFSLRVGSGSCFLDGRIRIWIFVWSGFQFGFFFSWIRSSRIWNPGWNYRKLLVEIWISLTANIDIEAGFSVSRRVIWVQIIVIKWLWGAMLPYAIFILSASQSVSHLGKP